MCRLCIKPQAAHVEPQSERRSRLLRASGRNTLTQERTRDRYFYYLLRIIYTYLDTLTKMDMSFLLSALCFCILSTGLAAPTPSASTAKSSSHVRTKRCSCATFLDKECVYFCHLDIIWVNTPERVVSYGLGNAPRTKRSSPGSMATGVGPRCRCLRENDPTCTNFCLHGYESRTHRVSRSVDGDSCSGARCKQKLSADNIKSDLNQVSASALRAVVQTRLLLEKWRMRRRHRDRAWDGESTAS